MIPVILSGGSGTRLWPISRTKLPKQFCEIFEKSLMDLTLERVKSMETPWILTGIALSPLTEQLRRDHSIPADQIIYEPMAKNTAPAIALLTKILANQGLSEKIVCVLPADHLIENIPAFLNSLHQAQELASSSQVVTLGIQAQSPNTGYGYIQKDPNSTQVLKFHEKPDLKTAQKFISSGNFYWNAGIFIFKVSTMLRQFEKLQPTMWAKIQTLKSDLSNITDVYKQIESISFDYAILEKMSSSELACIPCDCSWNDVGSWESVAESLKSIVSPQLCYEENSVDNFIFLVPRKHYALLGVQNLMVLDTPDALLISQKGEGQKVKNVVEHFKKLGSKITDEHLKEDRPWGDFEIIREESDYKSKVVRVHPGGQLSYQSHDQREEHWVVTRGQGEVVLNDKIISVQRGTYIHIPTKAKHRIRNTGKMTLEFVEVQLGNYLGEDDIHRYQDDYKRMES